MSKVISFRLDEANLREAHALQVLNSWLELGYSLRYIVTHALLELDQPGVETGRDDRSLGLVLDQIGRVIEIVRAIQPGQQIDQHHDGEPPALSESFLASIKQKARLGVRASG
jgi:hypothetical protein